MTVMVLGMLVGLVPASASASATNRVKLAGSVCAVPQCPFRGVSKRVTFTSPLSRNTKKSKVAGLKITISGLPKRTKASVQVTSPSNVVTTTTKSIKIKRAAPGQ